MLFDVWCKAEIKAVYPDCIACDGSGYAGKSGFEDECPDCKEARYAVDEKMRVVIGVLRLIGVDVESW